MSAGRTGDLEIVEAGSGLNHKLAAFCTVRAFGSIAGRRYSLTGQVSPAELRGMAMQFLAAAEAAESDAIVAAELVETAGVDQNAALGFVASLRKRREP